VVRVNPKKARPFQRVPVTATANRAERGVLPVLITKSFRQDLNQNSSSFPLPAEHSSWQRQPAILLPVPSGCLDHLGADAKKVSRRDHSQIGVLRDLVRPFASPLGEIAFDQSLQPPSNPPKHMSPVPGSRLLLKHFSKLLS
jgi:hypothetical protein